VDQDYTGPEMPPPDAVKGTYKGLDGKLIKVAALTDEDRRTILRWIDLGCPLELGTDAKNPEKRSSGWMLDDQRPTLTLTFPQAGVSTSISRLLVGMHDYSTG